MIEDASARLTAIAIQCQYGQDSSYDLVKQLEPYVTKQASSLEKASLDMAKKEDLMQIGNIEIANCVTKYDINSGPFLQFVMPAVRGAMLHYIRDKTLDVQIPGSVKETMYKVNKYINDYRRKYNNEPSVEHLCEALCMSYKRIEDALEVSKFIKLSKPIDDQEVADIAAADPFSDEDLMSAEDAKDLVAQVVALRKEGKNVEDFMALYGIDKEIAVAVIQSVDLHYFQTITIPDGEDLFDFMAGFL